MSSGGITASRPRRAARGGRARGGRTRALRLLSPIALALLPVLAACPANSTAVHPAADQFYFPTGLALSPDESVLFSVNANSDLRHDSGTIEVVDLAKVKTIADEWLATHKPPSGRNCQQDLMFPYVLTCDESEVIRKSATVRMGNFGTDVAVQRLDDGDLRLFVPVRGDPSVTWADYSPASGDLDCGGTGTLPLCDGAHRLTQIRNDVNLPALSPEPFGVYVDSTNGYAVVTHLTLGSVTLVDAPPDGSAPVLADEMGGLFAANPVTGVAGAVGVAGRDPGARNAQFYVTSRSDARVQTLSVYRPPGGGYPELVKGEHFFLNLVQPSTDARGIAFNADGTRAYVINRSPPMLHIIDTSLDDQGEPKNKLLDAVELCSEASNVTAADLGRGERVFVSCFQEGQVWVVDPEGGVVDATIDVGRGPYALAVAPGRERLYVSNFLENTVVVVDLTPGAPTENRVILRLGYPETESTTQ